MDAELLKMARSGKVEALSKIKDGHDHRSFLLQKTHKGNTALHIACKFGRRDFAAEIISLCPKLLLLQNSRGDTALHVAARAGHGDVVSALIECAEKREQNEAILGRVNKEGNTALHEAAATNRSGHVVVKRLIEKKPSLAFEFNSVGASPLYVAAERGCVESVGHILSVVKDSENVHCRGPHERTPLHAAVIRQHLEIMKEIMKELTIKKNDSIGQKDAYGNCPIHYAAALGNVQMVRMLLQADPSNAYLRNMKEQSPLHVAANNGHVNVIKELLKYCPDSGEAVDSNGCNGLHVAARRGNLEVVKHIIKSKYLVGLINETNTLGDTPLHLAIANHQLSVSCLLIKDERVDVNIKNKEGKTPLDIAEFDKTLAKKFRKIIMCKALIKSKGSRGLHQVNEENRRPRINSYKGFSKVISTVAGLIITVSFAAAFTVPGGFDSDGSSKGKAIFSRKPLLWLFIITDAIALLASIFVELVYFLAVIGDDDLLLAASSISIRLMAISLASLTLAFFFGLSLVVSDVLAVLAFVVSIGLFLLVLHWVRGFSWFPLFYYSLKPSIINKLSSIFCLCSSKRSTTQLVSLLPLQNLPRYPPQSSNQVEIQRISQAPTEIQHKNLPQNSAQLESQFTNPTETLCPNLSGSSDSSETLDTDQSQSSISNALADAQKYSSIIDIVRADNGISISTTTTSPQLSSLQKNLSSIFNFVGAYTEASDSSATPSTQPSSSQNLSLLMNLPSIENFISPGNPILKMMKYFRTDRASPQSSLQCLNPPRSLPHQQYVFSLTYQTLPPPRMLRPQLSNRSKKEITRTPSLNIRSNVGFREILKEGSSD